MRNVLLPLAFVFGCVPYIAAQPLTGEMVHANLSAPNLALNDLINTSATIGPGVEFSYSPIPATTISADFNGSILALTFANNSGATSAGSATVWRFTMLGERQFASFTELSDNYPMGATFFGIEDGTATIGIEDWDFATPNLTYTATFEVGTTGISQPVPEPETYALMLLGLTGVGLAARRRRRA